MEQVLYRVEYIIFCIRDLKNEGHNIKVTLPNLDNANHIEKN